MRLEILLSFTVTCLGTSLTTIDDGLGGFAPATSSCQYGKDYGARMTAWSQDLRRGGWRGAVLGPGGDGVSVAPIQMGRQGSRGSDVRWLVTTIGRVKHKFAKDVDFAIGSTIARREILDRFFMKLHNHTYKSTW